MVLHAVLLTLISLALTCVNVDNIHPISTNYYRIISLRCQCISAHHSHAAVHTIYSQAHSNGNE